MSIRRADSDKEKDSLAKKVASYRLGDVAHGVEPLSITDTMRVMGFKSTKSVYLYQNRAVELGLLDLDQDDNPILPKKTMLGEFQTFSKIHTLLQDERIGYWYKKQLMKKGGDGIKIAKDMLNLLERFFNTLRITPEMLIIQKSNKVIEDYRDQFLEAYKNGTDMRLSNARDRGSIKGMNLRINYALVSFVSNYGISWARGDPAMSRKIVGHGKYADIRLTKEEFVKADNYLKDTFGLDSDPFRWFWTGVETCGRYGALESMKLQFTEMQNKRGGLTLIMKAYEAKTKEKNDGIWTKWIKRQDNIESLKLLKARGGTRIYENKEGLSKAKFRIKMQDAMKSLFTHLGKDPDSYYFQKPAHVLRHIGAHYWLSKGNYTNHVLVAMIGGWHTVDELIKSYGTVPPEKVDEELDKYDY